MPDISRTRHELAAYAHNCWLRRVQRLFGMGEHHANGSVYFSRNVVEQMLHQADCTFDELGEDERASAECEADGMIKLARKSFYSVPAAACLGRALQEGPITLAQATRIVLDSAGIEHQGLSREEYLYWRKRCLRLLDSVSLVGGLAIWEEKNENGELVYDLLRPAGQDVKQIDT